MASWTTSPLYGDQSGYVPKFDSRPIRPHEDWQPTTAGSKENLLSWTSTCWVFQRQSESSGSEATPGLEQLLTPGTSRVQLSLELLAGLPQTRSAFSQSVTPDQLFSRTLREISILAVRALTRGSPPDSER